MEKVYLGLGTNRGSREENLIEAISLLTKAPLKITAISSIYETEPWGYEEQSDFLNLCLELETKLAPQELLEECQRIEDEMGRIRDKKWGPRIIDIDILVYDNREVETAQLTIPHPRIEERAFVLVPLQELNPSLKIRGKRITAYVKEISTEGIRDYDTKIEEL